MRKAALLLIILASLIAISSAGGWVKAYGGPDTSWVKAY